MLSFIEWLRSRIIYTDDKETACLDKIAADKNFPESVCLWEMLDYLDERYTKEEINIFISVYQKNYIRYITSAINPH